MYSRERARAWKRTDFFPQRESRGNIFWAKRATVITCHSSTLFRHPPAHLSPSPTSFLATPGKRLISKKRQPCSTIIPAMSSRRMRLKRRELLYVIQVDASSLPIAFTFRHQRRRCPPPPSFSTFSLSLSARERVGSGNRMKVERLKGAASLMRQPVVSKRGARAPPRILRVQVLMKSIPTPG